MINKERLLDRFLEYIQIDSPTTKERVFADFLKKEMEKIGLIVEMDNAGEKAGSDSGNLIGKLKGTTAGETILLSSHMDTVSPGCGIKPVIKDGIIYSDGTTILGGDDKAGIAAIMEAIETINDNNIPHADIEISFSIYEEGGLFGAKNLDYSKFKAKQAFVFDSGSSPGHIVVGAPAQNKIDVKFIGKTAHAGVAPETGISAIQIASEAIANMPLLRIDEETTANIGIIEGGGPTNIVTEEVHIKAEARSRDNKKLELQTEKMKQACLDAAKKFGGKAEITVKKMYSAFSIDPNDPIIAKVQVACKNLGLTSTLAKSGGGSDTNIFNENGITAVNLGIGQCNPHTVEEHISIKDLETSGDLVLEIIKGCV